MLARAVAEAPDEEGVLLLVTFEQELKRTFWTWQTIQRLMTKEGGPSDAAARVLRQIDENRDEHGMPEAEPRHPDLASGKRWPILQPDPDATTEG